MVLINEPVHTVKLYGKMRQRFGKEIKLSGHSAAAVIRGFALQNPEFGKALVQGFFHVLRGEKLKSAISYREDEIGAEIGSQSQVFHLIPVAAGAKSGIFNIIAGVAIMVAAVVASPFTGGASFGAAMGATAFWGISYGAIAMFGLGLALMGVAQMTAKTPKTDVSREEDNASSVINGPSNTATQGTAVPLVYGRAVVGSVLVASNLTAIDYSKGIDVTDEGWSNLKASDENGTWIPFTQYFTRVTKIESRMLLGGGKADTRVEIIFDYSTNIPKGFYAKAFNKDSGERIDLYFRWRARGWK